MSSPVGISTSRFFRLFWRAPRMRIVSWAASTEAGSAARAVDRSFISGVAPFGDRIQRLRIATRPWQRVAAKRKNYILPSMASLQRIRAIAAASVGAVLIVLIAACTGYSPWIAARMPPPEVLAAISPAELERHVTTLAS